MKLLNRDRKGAGAWAFFAAIFFCGTAMADLSETTLLQTNATLNLETGAVAGSGGDILWEGSAIAPQGSAKLRNIGMLGVTNFTGLPQSYFAPQAAAATAAPISAELLVPGDAFIVVTNSGKTAKVLVWANSGGVITLEFTTFGLSAPAGVPLIAQVVNNASYIPFGFPNYGIAPSGVFAVFGSGLADPGQPVPQASKAPGLPLSLNGTTITVVVNGVTTHPALYYTSPAQLAAVLPASTPVGIGILTVTYRGNTSAPVPFQVVPNALGINTYSNGVGVATDANTYALLSYTNSGSPGQTIVLWGTGLGADAADSDTTYTATPHSVNTPLQIYVGGVQASILYQGSSGYPGVNQIDLVIPKTVPAGCWIPVAAVAGGVVSNVVTISIHNGGGVCVDPPTGITGNQITPPNGKALKAGLVSLIQTNSPGKGGARTLTNDANAAFEQYTGLYPNRNPVSPGGCILTQEPAPVPFPNIVGLDTGAISITGPSEPAVTLKSQGIQGAFYTLLPADAIPSSGGTFTFHGAGGKDVGPFTSTLTLTSPLLTWTNLTAAAEIDRTKGLVVTWSGGNPGTYVFVTGTSTSTGLQLLGGYTCLVPIEDGQFTVPSYILSGLLPGKGGAALQNYVYGSLSASGIDIGVALADISYSIASTTQ
ncbi:MAG TPA: hypothetical protein VGP62_17375 [Bryobacteraceae bacterium]|jgi:uncharacterized protein (TIGR03437 family)|nr:hypothetical protein [Bryobacteraceae bacterium]